MESALTLLLFIVIIVAMLDCTRALFIQATIADRVRQALRYGALHATDLAGIQNIVLFGTSTAPARTPAFDLTRDMVQVSRPAPGTSDDHLAVRVTGYPIRLITPMVNGVIIGKPVSGAAPVESL